MKERKHDQEGNVIGRFNANPILDNREYEVKTRRTRFKERRGKDHIIGWNQHVPINKSRDDKESGEIFRMKNHHIDQEDLCLDLIHFGMSSTLISFDGDYYKC